MDIERHFQVPRVLEDYEFPLNWALEVNLTRSKAETIIRSFNVLKTTKDRISNISHHILKSFFLWFTHRTPGDNCIKDSKKELESASRILALWGKEIRVVDHPGYYEDYIDGVEYVIWGMKVLMDPQGHQGFSMAKPRGKAWAGVLHIKQEFFRPFMDEVDRRLVILKKIRIINDRDSRACLYLAKTMGQKRKMENFLSSPNKLEIDLLVEGHVKSRGDFSIIIELCYCLAQLLRNSKTSKNKYPLQFYNGAMVFKNEQAVADYINKETSQVWKDSPDAAPLYVKLAEIQSSLLPVKYQHPDITALALVDRALDRYAHYSKALHRKAKILFKLRRCREGLRYLELAFLHGETNCDALCDLVFRLLRYPEVEKTKLIRIFNKYCNNNGENLWGKRKVGTLHYLCGCYCWMMRDKIVAAKFWLEAEKCNPNPSFYFENLHLQKLNYRWNRGNLLVLPEIFKYLQTIVCPTLGDRFAMDSLISKLRSILDHYSY